MSGTLLLLLVCAQTETSTTLPPPKQFQAGVDDPMLAPAARPPREIATWDDAHRMLFARSTELESAEAGVERATGLWRQSLSVLLPNALGSIALSHDLLNPDIPFGLGVASGGAAASDRKPTTPLGTAAVTLSQSVVDLSAWRGLSSAAASERSATRALEDVRRRVTQGLAQSLIAVVAAERIAEINRVSLRQALERIALTERTYELGAATELDVVRLRQDVAVARSSLIAGDEELRRTREALALLLGTDEELGVSTRFDLNGLLDETRRRCRELRGDEERSDLIAAKEALEAAEASRASATAGYVPSLGLSSTLFAYTTDPGAGRFGSWSISAVISFPIWEGGLREGLVEERSGIAGQVAASAEDTRRSIHREITQARRVENVAKQLMSTAAEARSLATRTDAMTRRSFEIGRATSLELVQSAAVLRQAELSLALREFEWVQARLDAFLTEARCEG